MQIRIFGRPIEEDESGLGDYECDAVPRVGEVVQLDDQYPSERFEVERIEHRFINDTEPPRVYVIAKPID